MRTSSASVSASISAFIPNFAAALLLAASGFLFGSTDTLTAAPAPAPAQDNTIVGVVREKPVWVESSSPEIADLARRAFGAHGDYRLAKGAAARIRLVKTAPATVSVTLESQGARIAQSVTGADWRDATLRACDAVLVAERKRPFFAGKITFISDRTGRKEVYAGDLFFGTVQQLTSYNSICSSPRWTRDGSEVLHTTYHNHNYTDIFAVSADGRRRRGVIVNKRGTTTGAVSNPRTGQLAFANSGRGDMDIYTAAADGGGIHRVTSAKGVESDPAWSADGTKLAFAGGSVGRPGIHVIALPGGTPKRVATQANYSTEPSWNPVFQTKIAYTFQEGGFRIGVVDTATGSVEKIAVNLRGGGRVSGLSNPSWCADGRHLVATLRSGVTTRLVLVDTNTAAGNKATVLSGATMANCAEVDYFWSGK
ncbi:MAG: hypothetical protein LBR07_08625 [Puniceicoccales bacterium]|jgi:TolB protein|nr:hypothetical protein [Puniceicoccales bacterium]